MQDAKNWPSTCHRTRIIPSGVDISFYFFLSASSALLTGIYGGSPVSKQTFNWKGEKSVDYLFVVREQGWFERASETRQGWGHGQERSDCFVIPNPLLGVRAEKNKQKSEERKQVLFLWFFLILVETTLILTSEKSLDFKCFCAWSHITALACAKLWKTEANPWWAKLIISDAKI